MRPKDASKSRIKHALEIVPDAPIHSYTVVCVGGGESYLS